MSLFVSAVVAGLTTGATLALLATGLILVNRTTNVFNFAHGAIAMLASYLFFVQRDTKGTNAAVALLLALVVSVGCGLLMSLIIVSRLRGAPLATQMALTLGFTVAIQGVAALIWGPQQYFTGNLFGNRFIRLPLGSTLAYSALLAFAGSLVLASATMAFLRYTRWGLFLRARVDSSVGARVVGIRMARTGALAWVLGSVLAAAAGIFITPLYQVVDPFLLTILLIQAYVAALAGRLVSVAATMVGAFGFGLLTALFGAYAQGVPGEVREGLPYLLIFVLLWAQPKETALEAARRRIEGAV